MTDTNTTHKTLASALVAAQRDMPAVTTNAENPHFHSKFASLPHVVKHVLPVFLRHGISVTQTPINGETERYMGIRTILEHESGEQREYTFTLPLQKQDPQGAGSAITYARRYALCGLAGIAPDEDDDANDASTTTQTAEPPTAAPAPPPARDIRHGSYQITAVDDERGIELTAGSGEVRTVYPPSKKKPEERAALLGAARLYFSSGVPVIPDLNDWTSPKTQRTLTFCNGLQPQSEQAPGWGDAPNMGDTGNLPGVDPPSFPDASDIPL